MGAHLSALRRTEVGHFEIGNAMTLDELEEQRERGTLAERLISPTEMLHHLPAVDLDREGVNSMRNGRPVQARVAYAGTPVRVCDEGGSLIAVGDYDEEAAMIRPRIVLPGSDSR